MDSYLGQIESHLESRGWLEKHMYTGSTSLQNRLPICKGRNGDHKKGAPALPALLTENDPGPEIMDVTDITCTIWHRIDPAKARKVTGEGNQYWSYLYRP
ncbi:MAG: hypothetical protein R2744_03865 [Bacteroidales bacterium]